MFLQIYLIDRNDETRFFPHRLPGGAGVIQRPVHVDDPPRKLLVEIENILLDLSSRSRRTFPGGDNGHVDAGHRDDDRDGVDAVEGAGVEGAAIAAPISLCGRVINAIVWEETMWNLIATKRIVDVGSFLRLRNVGRVDAIRSPAGIDCEFIIPNRQISHT